MSIRAGWQRAAALALLATWGCTAETASVEELPEQDVAPIVNGTELSLNGWAVVAIYHQVSENPADGWSSRPCSGRILTPRAEQKAILTAAHCVNSDAAVPIPRSGLRVTAALRPGLATAELLFDPSRTVSPYRVVRAPADETYLGFENILDMAILWVDGHVPGLVDDPARSLIFMGATKAIAGFTTLVHFGYGCGSTDSDSLNGILRGGTGFTFDRFSGENYGPSGNDPIWYHYEQPGTNGAMVCRGDSGGPAILSRLQVGIHGSANTVEGRDVAVTRRSAEFIQGEIGRLYIKPKSGSGALQRERTGSGGWVSVRAESGGDLQKWRYDWPTKTIRSHVQAVCLDLQWSLVEQGAPVWMHTCNGTRAQRWRYKLDGHLESDWDGWCLARVANGGSEQGLELRQCTNESAQLWVWDVDSGAPGVF